MIEVGIYNELKILKDTKEGLVLANQEGEKINMPQKLKPEEAKEGDIIDVFIYLDGDGKKIATTKEPKIELYEFAFLKVNELTNIGAFMDWGMGKDLFVPYGEHKVDMVEGESYVIFMDWDEQSERLFGSNRIDRYLQNEELEVSTRDSVDLLVYAKTDLGYNVIIDDNHKGLVYENEAFKKIQIGDRLKGYVKTIRPDKKIDISLQPIGYERFKNVNNKTIYDKLKENGGFLAFTDKSAPDEIYAFFGMSKKAFKKSLGSLYKQRKIILENKGIKIVK